MWVYVSGGSTAFNLDHVNRLYVEETGSGAALKAEMSGKTHMVAYFGSKSEAQAALTDIMAKHGDNQPVVRF